MTWYTMNLYKYTHAKIQAVQVEVRVRNVQVQNQ